MRKTCLGPLTILLALLFAPQVNADILIDRPIDSSIPRTLNLAAGDFTNLSSYIVVDVTFDQDVLLDSITTFFDDAGTVWPSTLSATLNIFDGDPLTNADNPQNGQDVSVSVAFTPGATPGTGVHAVTADSFTPIVLAAGDYWIGLTPEFDVSAAPPNFYYNSATTGFNGGSFFRNPGAGLASGFWETDPNADGRPLQGAIRIEGQVVPEPSATAILALCGLLGLRRKR